MKFQVHRSNKNPRKKEKIKGKKLRQAKNKVTRLCVCVCVCAQHIYLHRKRKWKMLPGCFVLFILLLPEHLLWLSSYNCFFYLYLGYIFVEENSLKIIDKFY